MYEPSSFCNAWAGVLLVGLVSMQVRPATICGGFFVEDDVAWILAARLIDVSPVWINVIVDHCYIATFVIAYLTYSTATITALLFSSIK